MHFVCLIFPEISIYFSRWLTGDFLRNKGGVKELFLLCVRPGLP